LILDETRRHGAGSGHACRAQGSRPACAGARQALALTSGAAQRMVRAVCEDDQAAVGVSELDALRTGLQTLVAWWSSKPNQRAEAKTHGVETQRVKTQGAETQSVKTQGVETLKAKTQCLKTQC
jgi:hypothetical protein